MPGPALFQPPLSELLVTLSMSSSSPVGDIHSAQVLVHLGPFALETSPDLSPFALWTALPSADYYEDSVAVGLAPGRPSRVPLVLNVSSMT